jgi:hypothetical protein
VLLTPKDWKMRDAMVCIVTVRHVHGGDGSWSARLAGDIVKQRFHQTPIVGSAILLTENFLRDKFILSCVVQHPNAVHLFLFIPLKSAFIKRIARSLETSHTPNIFLT